MVEKEIVRRDLQEEITGKTDLQEEVIIEILSRLPVKSLLKFKSVCKSWYEIIKNPFLINKHLHNHYENDNGHLLVQRFIPESQLYGFESFTDKTLANLDQIVVDPYLQNTAYAQVVLGPLHGLYLIFNGQNRLALWNPGTREFKPLPSHPITLQLRVEDVYMSPPVLGFGHDPSTNDYKVGWFLLKEGVITKTMFLLYTLSNDSWRELNIDGFLSNSKVCVYSSSSNSNTYWNGFYYWKVSSYDYERGNSYKIYGLDMVNEVFSEIQGPPSPFIHLTLYKGRIATCSPMWNGQIAPTYADINVNIEIWVMESVGYWTKQLIFGPFPNHWQFLGCWINGGIFFKTEARNSRLILCNPGQELRDLGPRGLSHVYIHKESLVTLKGGGGNGNSKENVSTDLVSPIRVFFNLFPRRSCIYGEGSEKLIS